MTPPTTTTKNPRPKRRSNDDAFALAIRHLPPILTLLVILSIVSYVSQIILHPIYGSVGTSLHHYNILFGISTMTSLLTLLGFLGLDYLPTKNWKPLGVIIMAMPMLLPSLFQYSTLWGPVVGPIVTQGIMTWPCVLLVSHDIAKRVIAAVGKYEIRHSISLPAFLAPSIAIPLTVFTNFMELNVFIPFALPSIGIAWSRFSLLLFLGAFTLLIEYLPTFQNNARTRFEIFNLCIILTTFVPFILIGLNRPHIMTGVNPRLLAKLPEGFTYLARRESITGMISVVEHSNPGYRVLKCDHSILGGLWNGIKRNELKEKGVIEDLDFRSVDEAESCYTAFLLQEAARLVWRNKTESANDKALIIGLGVGITAKSFHNSNLNVSVVEIDPVVHQFAEQYFGLPKLRGIVAYEDGRRFIERYAKTGEKWDYIIHDVFTGGSVPAHLFTEEMWSATKAVLAKNGVLAVNMVGSLLDDSARAVIRTLYANFYKCRVFRDPFNYDRENPMNMVIFCSEFGVDFRLAKEEDFHGSVLRGKTLTGFRDRELYISNIEDPEFILTDANNKLEGWQIQGALEHWEVIRTVMPDEIWNNY